MEFLSLILFVGFSFACILSIKWATFWKLQKPVYVLSTILLWVLSLELFYGWLYSSKTIFDFPHALRLNTPFVFLIGPALYLFLRSLIQSEMKWKKYNLLHLIPFILVVAYLIPLYCNSSEQKLIYLEYMYVTLPLESYYLGGLRRLIQGMYLFFCLKVFVIQREQFKVFRTHWIGLGTILFFGTMWIVSIVRYFFHFELMSGLIDSILLTTFIVMLVFQFLKFGKIRLKPFEKMGEISRHINHINRLMNEHKVFLNPKYSLQDLSESLGMSTTGASRVVNQGIGKTFVDLINEHRIREAKILLSKQDTQHLTIEAIGRDAGFNSSSSFNYNFKKYTGQTPKTFRKIN